MAASVGDIYEVSIVYDAPTGVFQNNFGFVCVAADAGDAQANLGAAVQNVLLKNTSGGILHGAGSDVSSSRLEVADIKPGVLATYVRTYAAVTGSGGNELAPPQCAVVMSLRTALKGRSYRGRIYIPGLQEYNQTGGTLSGTALTAYQTIPTNIMAAFGPLSSNGTWELAIISRWLNKVKRATPVATKVTSISVSGTIYTQRRRVRGVGS